MSLDLDDRQRAMLAEMGVHVWWPATPAESEPPPELLADDLREATDAAGALADDPAFDGPYPEDWLPGGDAAWPADALSAPPAPGVPAAADALAASPASAPLGRRKLPITAAALPGPSSLLPLPEGIAAMDWPALGASVAHCQACAMCLGRRAPVLAAPASGLQADWLIVGEPPDDAQERAGMPFVDDAGRLLDNMLKAVGVRRYPAGSAAQVPDPSAIAYLTLVLKCRPALPGVPDAQALAACANYLQREIALVRPKVILAMGRVAMQLLLSQDHPHGPKLPLGKLRGQVWHYQGVPVVVTYPPAYLLRSGQDKARAWEDLCLAQAVARQRRVD